jgi:hypothetical protein
MEQEKILYLVCMELAKRRKKQLGLDNIGPNDSTRMTFDELVSYADAKSNFKADMGHGCNCRRISMVGDCTRDYSGACKECFDEDRKEIEEDYKLLGVPFGDE